MYTQPASPLARILPSHVVSLIQQLFPEAATPGGQVSVALGQFGQLRALLAVLDGVPPELIAVDGVQLIALTVARTIVEDHLERFRVHGTTAPPLPGHYVASIRQVFEQCPDELIPAALAPLRFIREKRFRESLRLDIASAERGLRDGDWKSATVLAGSVIEALLLWKLRKEPAAKVKAAGQRLVSTNTIAKPNARR